MTFIIKIKRIILSIISGPQTLPEDYSLSSGGRGAFGQGGFVQAALAGRRQDYFSLDPDIDLKERKL